MVWIGQGQVYLVTGGCGFLGRHLVEMLVERGGNISEVRVFDLHLDESMRQLGTDRVKVKLIKGDIIDAAQVNAAVQGADVVIHTASLVDVWDKVPATMIEAVNVKEGCSQSVRRRGRGGSLGEARGSPPCVKEDSAEILPKKLFSFFVRGNEDTLYNIHHDKPYPRSKAKAEELVIKANGRQIVVGKKLYTCALRPTGIYGENHELMKKFYQQGLRMGRCLVRAIPLATEHGRVYVGNVAWMHLLAAQALQEKPSALGGQIYFCYDESPYRSYDDFNMEFLASCGFRMIGSRPVVPYFLLYLIAVINEVLQSLLRPFCTYSPLMNKYTLAVATTTFTVNTDKAERHFGYRPLYTWEESKRRTIGWLRALDAEYRKNSTQSSQ
nr:PREDICTED: 3 beta-hydroxysteroid dehydrogenase type 7 [Latimeria chalumnae]|eukprot:XP_006002255.1 PREDICTED: 3 beta-hydroxysteroid dehydrogenase type 7 [Latimeria chalumnae]